MHSQTTLILVGDSHVGKTHLALKFAHRDADPPSATIGVDFYTRDYTINKKTHRVQLWDTAGQERFRSITRSYYNSIHGAALVFDLTSRNSFDNIQVWLDDIREKGPVDVPVIIIGNKKDKTRNREVGLEIIKEFTDKYNLKYVETSIHDIESIEKAFEYLIEAKSPVVEKEVVDVREDKKEGCFCVLM